MSRFYLLPVAALLMAACATQESADQAAARIQTESVAARAAIDSINVGYARILANNQADSVAMLFMENGVMMPPGAPAVTGRDSIAAYLRRNGFPPGASMMFHSVSVAANGPIAIERGTYMFTMPNPRAGQPAISINGKYLSHWHKVGNQWLQAASIWSDDVPMTAPPGS